MIDMKQVKGLWRRSFIKMPADDPVFEDHETHVYWFQADDIYADLRIPLKKATGSAPSPEVEGFAGISVLDGDQCTWHRFINLQGAMKAPDIGTLTLTPDGLYEVGLERSYEELWTPVPVQGSVLSAAYGADEWLAILVWSDSHFLIAVDQPSRVEGNLGDKEDQGSSCEATVGTYCFGLFKGTQGVAHLSNRADLVKKAVLNDLDQDMFRPTAMLEKWFGRRTWSRLNLASDISGFSKPK